MKTHTQLLKRFFATLLFSTLVLVFPNSPAADSFDDGFQAYEAGDYKKALEIIKPIAEQGGDLAQFYLGHMYSEGEGVPRDETEAVKWYRKAAEQGMPSAQYYLGLMYLNGEGVAKDYIEAHKWYNLAASRFSPGDDQKVARKDRDLAEGQMTPAEIEEAQKLAREWKPKPAQ